MSKSLTVRASPGLPSLLPMSRIIKSLTFEEKSYEQAIIIEGRNIGNTF